MWAILPDMTISLPKEDENDTGLIFANNCIQWGKFSLGKRAVLENINGRFIKLAKTVGICQSELFIVINKYIDDNPRLNKNNAATKKIMPIGEGITTPNNITPRNTMGIWNIPLVDAPKTFARKIIKFFVGVTIILLKYPDFLSWIKLNELNIPTNNIEVDNWPDNKNAK